MHPNLESEVEPGNEAESLGGRDDFADPDLDLDREGIRRAQMVGRACERRAYWQRELAAERFNEFKPEMRRRIQVEDAFLNALEAANVPTFVLLRNYQRDAMHATNQPKTEAEQTQSLLVDRIAKATRRKRDLGEALRLTPQKQTTERRRLLTEIDTEQAHIDDLKAEIRGTRH